ncbi:glycosyltransferase [Paenibacillus sp. GCM10023252]|uniref:glycosyltransferase n=1 Tax=Paenibacillus sp. GCM10023252 TaxID=3252649 RepID=UPI00361B70FE
MITISLCMIVKNEEQVLARCLDSVHSVVDEIIIVDTGSTDRTIEIAKRYTQHVHHFKWIDDFAAARNEAFSKATMSHILWLDADDVLLDADRKKLTLLKLTLGEHVDSVLMDYHLSADENGQVTTSLKRNRLVRSDRGFRWVGAVHEYLAVSGTSIDGGIAVTHLREEHDRDRNIRIYEAMLQQGQTLSVRDLYYYGNELLDHGHYERAIASYEQFLATKQGWVEDCIAACGKLADCFAHLDRHEDALRYALRSFEYDTPRAEFCCRIGYWFLQQERYQTAVHWYKTASELDDPKARMSLTNRACQTWLPHLQLCVCYDRLGMTELAYEHNERALAYRPADSVILNNKRYLEGILQSKPTAEEATRM